ISKNIGMNNKPIYRNKLVEWIVLFRMLCGKLTAEIVHLEHVPYRLRFLRSGTLSSSKVFANVMYRNAGLEVAVEQEVDRSNRMNNASRPNFKPPAHKRNRPLTPHLFYHLTRQLLIFIV